MLRILLPLIAVLLCGCGAKPIVPPRPDAAVVDTDPPDAGVEPKHADAILALDNTGNGLVFFDDDELGIVRRVPTGVGPHEVAVSGDQTLAVVSDYGTQSVVGHTLTVIDVTEFRVLKTIDLKPLQRPHGIAFLGASHRVLVTCEASHALAVVDVDRGVLESEISTTEQLTHMLATSSSGDRAFAANLVSATVSSVNLGTAFVGKSVAVDVNPEGIGVTPDGSRVWVASRTRNTVTVLDGADLSELAKFSVDALPIRIAASPDGTKMFVTAAQAQKLLVFDAKTNAPLGEVAFTAPAGPFGLTVSPDGKRVFVGLLEQKAVADVDVATLTVTRVLPLYGQPDGLSYVKR